MTREELQALAEMYGEGKPSRHATVEALLAHIRDLTTWRPMETAPRDGTRILVLRKIGGAWAAHAVINSHWQINGIQELRDDELAGWLPLLPGPEVRSDAP